MMHFKPAFWKKQGLAAVLAVVLLLAAGCGAGSGNAAEDSAAAPGAPEVTTAEPIETSRAEEESTLPAEEAEEAPAAEEPAESTPAEEAPAEEAPAEEEPAAESARIPPRPMMGIDADVARLNCFLTSIVQQNIVNTQTDLDEDAELVRSLFAALGSAQVMTEAQLDAVIGVSGSAPAYVYMFVDALADAGVLGGLHRDQAVRMAAQMLYGSAALLKETGKSPAELREMVCSPAGTTIEAVASLEESGFRGAVIKAAGKAMEKAKKMG